MKLVDAKEPEGWKREQDGNSLFVNGWTVTSGYDDYGTYYERCERAGRVRWLRLADDREVLTDGTD